MQVEMVPHRGLDQGKVPAPGQTLSSEADVRICWNSLSCHCPQCPSSKTGDDVMGTDVSFLKGWARGSGVGGSGRGHLLGQPFFPTPGLMGEVGPEDPHFFLIGFCII